MEIAMHPIIQAVMAMIAIMCITPSLPPQKSSTEKPIILLYETKPASGPELLTAIWADGTILTRRHINDVNSTLVVTSADRESISSCIKSLNSAGFFDGPPEVYSMPDATTMTIVGVSDSKSNKLEWTERLALSSRDGKDAAYIKFVKKWLAVRGAVLSVPFLDIRTLEASLDGEGEFRGYNPKKPGMTDWLK